MQLILWTCGPVQDFIASARKGRDLWFGSWILSEVSKAAALAIRAEQGDLIMPAPADDAELASPDFDVPNRILAQVPAGTARAVAEAATEAARGRLLRLADTLFDHMDGRLRAGSDGARLYSREHARAQIADLLEVSWAAVTETGDARVDRKRVEGLLAARKSQRAFAEPGFASWHVPKSSLDGQRECVTSPGVGLRLGLNPKERLCGVGLLKRLGHLVLRDDEKADRIPSVSSFALLSWLRPVLAEENRCEVEDAIQAFGQTLTHALPEHGSDLRITAPAQPLFGPLDPHAFFASRLHEFVGEDVDASGIEAVHADAFATLRARLRDIAPDLPASPTPYMVVLVGDGDKLGETLDSLDHAGVKAVSRALSAFAKRVRDEVFDPKKLEGICVYAGGDDVLAFAPVDVALRKANELSEAFAEAFDGLDVPLDKKPTFSVGIAVAHHLSPLRDSLDAARAAEQIAKHTAGRNAWAVRIVKRSGSPLDIHGKWGEPYAAIAALTADSAATGVLPRGLAYDLKDAAIRLDPKGAARREAATALERCELERILRQKFKSAQLDQENGEPALIRVRALTQTHNLRAIADRLVAARALSGMGGQA